MSTADAGQACALALRHGGQAPSWALPAEGVAPPARAAAAMWREVLGMLLLLRRDESCMGMHGNGGPSDYKLQGPSLKPIFAYALAQNEFSGLLKYGGNDWVVRGWPGF